MTSSPRPVVTRVLVPTDFSDFSSAALNYAASLASSYGAALRLLHVITPFPIVVPLGDVPGNTQLYDSQRAQCYKALTSEAATIGLFSGSTTYGTGYEEAKLIIEGRDELPAGYGLLKMLASVVSYASGIPGGIFAPSLAVGAGFGINAAQLMPYAPHGAVVLLAMVGYFSGVVRAPITAFVIVIEMTDNHNMVLPLMAAALIASGTSRLICPRPLYKTLADAFLAKAPAPDPEENAPRPPDKA